MPHVVPTQLPSSLPLTAVTIMENPEQLLTQPQPVVTTTLDLNGEDESVFPKVRNICCSEC